jgi:hypothetical protein
MVVMDDNVNEGSTNNKRTYHRIYNGYRVTHSLDGFEREKCVTQFLLISFLTK